MDLDKRVATLRRRRRRPGRPKAAEQGPRASEQPWARLLERGQGWTVARYARRYLFEHQGSDLAAGIAFHALLYIFPMIGAILAILGAILRNDRLLARVSLRIVQLFPSDWQENIGALLVTRNNAGWFGIISLLGLFWLGSSFIASLARAFNRLYGVPSRNIVRQRLVSLGMILLFAVLLSVTVAASVGANLILGISSALLPRIGATLPFPEVLSSVLAFGISLLTAFALFVALYWRLPYVRHGYRDIWRGAALATVLLVATTQIFPFYLRFAPANQYSAAFAFIFLLATWLYLVAHSILIGAALNAFRRDHWLPRPLAREKAVSSCDQPGEDAEWAVSDR